jgi:hypothetical protein
VGNSCTTAISAASHNGDVTGARYRKSTFGEREFETHEGFVVLLGTAGSSPGWRKRRLRNDIGILYCGSGGFKKTSTRRIRNDIEVFIAGTVLFCFGCGTSEVFTACE